MRTRKAMGDFLEAKQDLSPHTLEQYRRALDYLEREVPEMPGKPELLRRALNQIKSAWVRDAFWRVCKIFFRWCWWDFAAYAEDAYSFTEQ